MKQYLIVLLVLMTCNLMSDDVRIVWIGNSEGEKVTHYEVYKAEGSDSTDLNLVLIDSVDHVFEGQEHFYVTPFDSNYIKGGVRAVNANGASLDTSKTRAYSQQELALPSSILFASPAIRRN